ncbi:MAG TPA: hypothetical protein VF470_09445 [Sphingomicrobium sp.]
MSSRHGPFVIDYDQVESADSAQIMVGDIEGAVDEYLAVNPDAGLPLSVRIDLAVYVDQTQTGMDLDQAELLAGEGARLLEAASLSASLSAKAVVALSGLSPDLTEEENEDIAGNSGVVTTVYLVWIN